MPTSTIPRCAGTAAVHCWPRTCGSRTDARATPYVASIMGWCPLTRAHAPSAIRCRAEARGGQTPTEEKTMGNWVIVIEGCGCHHNDEAHVVDANRQAAEFVQALRDAGHTVGARPSRPAGVTATSPQSGNSDAGKAVGNPPGDRSVESRRRRQSSG